MLTLPDDREKLRSLDETLRNIISYESDRDVRKVSWIIEIGDIFDACLFTCYH